MLDLGLLSRKELSGFSARKNLSRYIGFNGNGLVLRADEYYPFYENGMFLLCSDGISDSLAESEIVDVFREENDIATAAKKLIQRAVDGDNSDNATVIFVPIGR
jgi:protein phosphatase